MKTRPQSLQSHLPQRDLPYWDCSSIHRCKFLSSRSRSRRLGFQNLRMRFTSRGTTKLIIAALTDAGGHWAVSNYDFLQQSFISIDGSSTGPRNLEDRREFGSFARPTLSFVNVFPCFSIGNSTVHCIRERVCHVTATTTR